ncbi:protealysin inhibitor emfourin [[Empedobacter] haloabium]|uniref:Protealysin inhibitor emfourin n=1 Tax=[Empedobacter] haloabium TaxID=592317 RepID=A0ABZ1UDD1_9BURK
MRIELVTEGGFAAMPGLQRPFVLDCGSLPAAQAAECERLARALATAPPAAAAPAALRDARRYRLAFVLDERPHVVAATDQAMSAEFDQLVQLVRQYGRRVD